MIRDRLKRAVRKAALKAFGMEKDAEDRDPNAARPATHTYDPSVIPRIQEGSGDTPGPNHKELIGRTFLAAQVVGGHSDVIVDMRPPQEWIAGHIPGAVLLPGRQLLERTDLLPTQDRRVSIYDATGEQGSLALALAVRDRGWKYARALEGGWAHWIEHDEPTTLPEPVEDARFQLGDTVSLADGRQGVVQAVEPGPRYTVLLDFDADDVVAGLSEDDLRG
ncbi:MAG: hypothetical protein H6739_03730 [Alphaproteobacteria bacterium]|nr:hypothetical protein [Alphaproteobacteria bacterium]